MDRKLHTRPIRAYHFTGATLRDGRPIPPIGEWLEHEGAIVPCKSGLHASIHPYDALKFAPSFLLHLVDIEGDIQACGEPGELPDKVVGRRRKIVASLEAGLLIRELSRWSALRREPARDPVWAPHYTVQATWDAWSVAAALAALRKHFRLLVEAVFKQYEQDAISQSE